MNEEEINLSAPHFFQTKISVPFPKALKEVAQTFRGYHLIRKNRLKKNLVLGNIVFLN